MKSNTNWNVIVGVLVAGPALFLAGLWHARRQQVPRPSIDSGQTSPTTDETPPLVGAAAHLKERARKTSRYAVVLVCSGAMFFLGSVAMDRFLAESANPALPTLVSATGFLAILSILAAALNASASLWYLGGVSKAVAIGRDEKDRRHLAGS